MCSPYLLLLLYLLTSPLGCSRHWFLGHHFILIGSSLSGCRASTSGCTHSCIRRLTLLLCSLSSFESRCRDWLHLNWRVLPLNLGSLAGLPLLWWRHGLYSLSLLNLLPPLHGGSRNRLLLHWRVGPLNLRPLGRSCLHLLLRGFGLCLIHELLAPLHGSCRDGLSLDLLNRPGYPPLSWVL